MTSPRKNVDMEKETTMFGKLNSIQKQSTFMSRQMLDEIEQVRRIQAEFAGIEKQARQSGDDSKSKLGEDAKQFEEKIKNYLIGQKAEYMRFANQINLMIQNSKEINAQLTLLNNRFEEFKKNVGV